MLIKVYIMGRGDQWEAVCTNFDLAVQGRSFDDCYALIKGAVDEYFEYINELPIEERGAFLRRRMPLSERIKLSLMTLISTIIHRDNEPSGRAAISFAHA